MGIKFTKEKEENSNKFLLKILKRYYIHNSLSRTFKTPKTAATRYRKTSLENERKQEKFF